jgi:hypothetical protein
MAHGGSGLRAFKDEGCPVESDWALGFGAILSAFLEAQIERAGFLGYDLITTVPTTAPVIERALRRAAVEGWWTPPGVTQVAEIAGGHMRQRDRSARERVEVDVAKWSVDHSVLNGAMTVLILDDMLTTGGSVFSFGAALGRAGVSFVDAIVMMRNVGQNDASWVRPRLLEAVARGQAWTPAVQKRDLFRRHG